MDYFYLTEMKETHDKRVKKDLNQPMGYKGCNIKKYKKNVFNFKQRPWRL